MGSYLLENMFRQNEGINQEGLQDTKNRGSRENKGEGTSKDNGEMKFEAGSCTAGLRRPVRAAAVGLRAPEMSILRCTEKQYCKRVWAYVN